MDSDFTTNQSYGSAIWLTIWLCSLLLSCKTATRVGYFQDIPDSSFTKPKELLVSKYQLPLIQVGDVLNISVYTNETPAIHTNPPSGLLNPVDEHGNVELPIIGKIEAEGLSTDQVHDILLIQANKYYRNPVVIVRFANFTVNVLGEVSKPGQFTVNQEKLSVLDALALAGDISIYGKKENVLVVRNTSTHKAAMRLNLYSSKSLASPFFYLRQGDIVFVEPNKHKLAATRDVSKARNYALIASGISVLIILLSRISF